MRIKIAYSDQTPLNTLADWRSFWVNYLNGFDSIAEMCLEEPISGENQSKAVKSLVD